MFQLLIQGMSHLILARVSVGVRVALLGRRRICKPSFLLDSLWLERPDTNGPELLRDGPSGEERYTPHHMVPVSPQCPQEIGLLTLPVFQSRETGSLSRSPGGVGAPAKRVSLGPA